MNNYFVLLCKMQKQKHFRCAQNEFKLYVFETCKVAKRFFSLFMQFHSMPVEELELAELLHCTEMRFPVSFPVDLLLLQ